MKYGGDKIKVVTDGLNLGDKLEALGFDRCGYLLIGKWNNSYGTKGDPLMSSETPCGEEANCPNCQPVIDNVVDLPGRPNPCNDGDAFIMMSRTGKLKVLCKSQFDDHDRKVAVSDGDEIAGHLKDKLIVCDDDGPLSFHENEDGSFHTYCLDWDPSKAGMKFIDLIDTPDDYCDPGLLYSDGKKISCIIPRNCGGTGADTDYLEYVVYDHGTGTFTTKCDSGLSYASWEFSGGTCEVPVDSEGERIYATNFNEDINPNLKFNGSGTLYCTNDIITGTGHFLFGLTQPGIYVITCNSTLRNQTEAGLQAVRGGLLLTNSYGSEVEWTDFKYDARSYSKYINDFYPNNLDPDYTEDSSPTGRSERNLELSIMSFNTTHTVIVEESVSPQNPYLIGFWVRCSTYLHDHRMYPAAEDAGVEELESITLELADGTPNVGPRTRITCARIGFRPADYQRRF